MSEGVNKVDLLKAKGVVDSTEISETEIDKKAQEDAQLLFDYADSLSGAPEKAQFQKVLGKVNKNSVISLIKSYKKISPDESIVEMIFDEVGASKDSRKKSVQMLFNALKEKCAEMGIDTSTYEENFSKELKHQFDKWGFADS